MNGHTISEVLKKYGLKPEKWTLISEKRDRSVWKVRANDKNDYALKLVRTQKAKIISQVGLYLSKRGVPVITTLPTKKGDFFVQKKDLSFVLFPWFKGKAIIYDTPGTIEKMSIFLAQFHEASRGYAATDNPIRKRPFKHFREFANMKEVYKEISHLDSQVVKLFSSHYDWLQKRCKWVIERLPDTQEALAKYNPDSLLSHGDYARPNILSDKNGDWKMIDLDTVGISIPMTDVSKMITLVNHDLGDWDPERFQLIVQSYNDIRQISQEEKDFLMIDQCFPHQAIDLLNSFYKKSPSTTLVEELERCLATDKQKLKAFDIRF